MSLIPHPSPIPWWFPFKYFRRNRLRLFFLPKHHERFLPSCALNNINFLFQSLFVRHLFPFCFRLIPNAVARNEEKNITDNNNVQTRFLSHFKHLHLTVFILRLRLEGCVESNLESITRQNCEWLRLKMLSIGDVLEWKGPYRVEGKIIWYSVGLKADGRLGQSIQIPFKDFFLVGTEAYEDFEFVPPSSADIVNNVGSQRNETHMFPGFESSQSSSSGAFRDNARSFRELCQKEIFSSTNTTKAELKERKLNVKTQFAFPWKLFLFILSLPWAERKKSLLMLCIFGSSCWCFSERGKNIIILFGDIEWNRRVTVFARFYPSVLSGLRVVFFH